MCLIMLKVMLTFYVEGAYKCAFDSVERVLNVYVKGDVKCVIMLKGVLIIYVGVLNVFMLKRLLYFYVEGYVNLFEC